MDENLDFAMLRVRADTAAFRRDVEDMRTALETSLDSGANTAGRGVSSALARAARSGKLEFEDLAKAASRALGEIAAAALKIGPAQAAGGGLAGLLSGVVSGMMGAPGRATGGPVSPGKAYVVGERGPELFVPTSSGRVEVPGTARAPVNVTVNVSASGGASADYMARTGRQVARQVRRALDRAGG
ncbi:MAG: tail tape measure protein [Sphingomonadaceae bacterium]